MRTEYINRDGDILVYEDNGEYVEMIQGNDLPVGVSGNVDNGGNWVLNSHDCSGGPFISTGDNIKWLFKDGKDRVITSITWNKDENVKFKYK